MSQLMKVFERSYFVATSFFWLVVVLLIPYKTFAQEPFDPFATTEIPVIHMAELSDDDLAAEVGQSLFFANYKTGDGAANGTLGMDFYRLGFDTQIDINANIKSLKLGCGGINGAGLCDIDLDNVSLSGNCASNRPGCDAVITRPFFEFAIKNPGSLSTRTVAGFRISAENLTGLLTAGTNTVLPNGINRLSGHMVIQNTTGTATTDPGVFGTVDALTGKANINIALCTTGCGNGKGYVTLPASSVGLNIPSLTVPFSIPSFTIEGSRLASATVNASAPVPQINLGYTDGQLAVHLNQQVCVLFLICLQDTRMRVQMQLSGILVDIGFSEALGYIHNIPLNNPFSLSAQKENIKWPGMAETAMRGWWMSFQDSINIGTLTPTNTVDISGIYPQLATLLSNYLNANPVSISTGAGLQALVSGSMDVNVGAVNLAGQHVALPLADLQLSTQNVTPNCWGGLSFC